MALSKSIATQVRALSGTLGHVTFKGLGAAYNVLENLLWSVKNKSTYSSTIRAFCTFLPGQCIDRIKKKLYFFLRAWWQTGYNLENCTQPWKLHNKVSGPFFMSLISQPDALAVFSWGWARGATHACLKCHGFWSVSTLESPQTWSVFNPHSYESYWEALSCCHFCMIWRRTFTNLS